MRHNPPFLSITFSLTGLKYIFRNEGLQKVIMSWELLLWHRANFLAKIEIET